jgi:hypothetical protein
MDNPHHLDCDLTALAQACDERATELQACAWRNEHERNALREDTAQLLASIARQLSEVFCTTLPTPLLDGDDVRRIIDTQVEHAPLAAVTLDHAWIGEFTPGGNPSAKPTE